MNIEQEKQDDLHTEIKIRLEPEDYKENYEKAIRQYKKRIDLPGFRPGKVPNSLIKKKYGRSVLAEELGNILNEALQGYIRDNELDVLGQPLPKQKAEPSIDPVNLQSIEFSYEVGLAPTIEIPALEGIEVPYYTIEPEKEKVDERVHDLRRQYGQLRDVEEAGKEDMLMGTLEELDEEGTPKKEGISNETSIGLEQLSDEEMKEQLVGLQKGATIDLDPHRISKGPEDLAKMLGIEKEEAEGMNARFRFTVEGIKRMEPAPVDQTFFDKIFGEGEVTSEESFRERVANEIRNSLQGEVDKYFKQKVREKLLQEIDIQLPDEFLKRYLDEMNEELSKEHIEEKYGEYKEGFKWELIQNKLIRENEIKVDEEEAKEHVKSLLAGQQQRFGMAAPDDETLEQSANNILQNEEQRRNLYDSLYEEKIINFLKGHLSLKEETLSYDEFLKLVTEQSSAKTGVGEENKEDEPQQT